jgi:hypothetical protein
LHDGLQRRHVVYRTPDRRWRRHHVPATGQRLTSGWTRRPGVRRQRGVRPPCGAGPRVSLSVRRSENLV